MDIIKDVLCRLLILTGSSRNFYMPTSTTFQLFNFNVTSASDLCLTQLYVKEDSNVAIELPEDRDLLPLLNASDTCKTPSCVKAAANILSIIDETVKPCDDFYKFSCGGWLKRQVDDISALGYLGRVSEKKLRVILEKKLKGDQRDFLRQIKAFYDSCMIKNRKADIKQLLTILKDLGGWPVIEGKTWNASSFDWIDARSRILDIGAKDNFLVELLFDEDPRNESLEIITLRKMLSRHLENTFLIKGPDEKKRNQYFTSMIQIAKTLSANVPTSLEEFRDIIRFETKLLNFTSGIWEKENDTYCTIHELKDKVPQIDWRKFFKTIRNKEILETETVLVSDLNYIIALTNFITNASERVLANYMIWKFVQKSFPLLGLNWTPSRKNCFDYIYEKFHLILDSIYVRQYFPEDIKKTALEVTTYVHNEYINMLKKIDWMDEKSTAYSVKRANVTKLQVGYPEELLNDTFLSEIWDNVTYNNESFFYNNLKREKWYITTFMARLIQQPEMWLPHYRITEAGANIVLSGNKIRISTALFQNPMFSKDRPHYLNFGALGFFYGHEIIHEFNGERREPFFGKIIGNQWSKETNENFKKKADCFLKQYAEYTIHNGMKVNSNKTKKENIADNLGYELAYLAYQSWVKDNGREPMLPGLKYTPNQLFWINAANAQCQKLSPDTTAKLRKEDEHSLPQFRVIGSMSNIPEFSKDFNCPPGSAMNPRNKCRVWRDN